MTDWFTDPISDDEWNRFVLERAGIKPKFPAVVRAEDMHRECVRDGWQMAWNPWVSRGRDHG